MNHGTVNVFEHMNIKFLQKIDQLRHDFGYPMSPSSSYRTKSFNISIGRSKNSMHLLGRAYDFPFRHYTGKQRIELIQKAMALVLTVGVRDDILHIDDRDDQTVFGY